VVRIIVGHQPVMCSKCHRLANLSRRQKVLLADLRILLGAEPDLAYPLGHGPERMAEKLKRWLTDVVIPPARSAYDVRVVEIRSLWETVRSWPVGAVGFCIDSDLLLPRVRVEIVDVATGQPLAEWKCRATEATELKAKIESDLDGQDAEAFATGWSLPTPRGEGVESN
jgi:hypothetical protein